MIVTDKSAQNWNKKVEFDKITTLYLENLNIKSILFKTIQWNNLLILSLKNNSLNKIVFINNMPNLYFLDIRNNMVII